MPLKKAYQRLKRALRPRHTKEQIATIRKGAAYGKQVVPVIGGVSMAAKKSLSAALSAGIRRSPGLLKSVRTVAGRARIAKRIKQLQPILKGRKEATELIRKGISVGLRKRALIKAARTSSGRKKIARRIAELIKEAKK